MKLWLLSRVKEEVGWEENSAMVIRSETELEARQIAASAANGEWQGIDEGAEEPSIWRNSACSTCLEVLLQEPAQPILVANKGS